MKKLITALTLALTSCLATAGLPVTYVYDITPSVTIYLTDDPCLMWKVEPGGPVLFAAKAKDTLVGEEVYGCWTRGTDGKVEIKLVNTKDSKMYDFVLPEALFTPAANI
jgi:hypothetical protein